MNSFKEFRTGISSFFKAIPFIFKHKLGWFFLFPFLFQLAFFATGFYAVNELVDLLVGQINDWWGVKDWEFEWAGFAADVIYVFVWLILKIAFFLVFSYFSGYVVLIFLSPVLAFLSEKTEKILTGNEYPFSLPQLMKDMMRGIIVALRNLCLELGLTLIIIMIGFIPVIGLISPFLLFGVTAYYYGFSFVDYNNERRKYSFKKSVRLMRRRKFLLMGVASPFAVILIIPYVGQFLSGFFAIIATVGSVMAYRDIEEDMAKREAELQNR